MLQFVLIILLFIPIIVESKGEWSYENIKKWSHGNRYCGGNLQSPIDLRFNVSQNDHRLRHIALDERYPREPTELVNNGHTAQLNLKNHYVLKHVAPGSEDYKVEQLHFHWGHLHDNINGSEHLHEGRSYPLEMHVVSYSNLYPSIREAMTNTRSLAVVGVFFELSHEPNPLFQPLVDALARIQRQGQQGIVSEEFSLKALIGEERMRRYYRYDGSLTTPPCFESVIWSVLVEPLKISALQLHAFKNLYDDKTKLIENTYRTVQPLGTRILFRSFHSENIHDDLKHRTAVAEKVAENNGQNLKNNMKLLIVISSLLMVIVF